MSVWSLQSRNHQPLHHLNDPQSEGKLQGGRGKRGQGGKRDTRWVLKYEETGSVPELNNRIQEILHELQEELGVSLSHHPYKCAKPASPEKIRLS